MTWPDHVRGEDIPARAQYFKRDLTRLVHQEWGLSGEVALHAAQIHQESLWRAKVDSHAGAQGLAQFMPSTSSWLVGVYPELGDARPYSPGWAMRAMARYNRWHWSRIAAADNCERWAMTLSAYNGGLGWLRRDQQLTAAAGCDLSCGDPSRWCGHVELHTSRADWARRENRRYVSRILNELAPRYQRAGWRGSSICP
jgi:soluble lytic murein transglycosylase-like protein